MQQLNKILVFDTSTKLYLAKISLNWAKQRKTLNEKKSIPDIRLTSTKELKNLIGERMENRNKKGGQK